MVETMTIINNPKRQWLSALLESCDILFVAAVYDRHHLPALTERRYNIFLRPAGT
jgi:hypothetical protein